ncbi:MAG: adenylate cyclase regulatory domain-containing protein [Thermoleophilaceae bacterium]
MATDFDAEGLLEGLEGNARAARLELLEQLERDGVDPDELRSASAEGRLALVPVEQILVGDSARYTLSEISERTDVEPEFLDRYWRAMGMTSAGDDEPIYLDADLAAAERIGALREAGLADDSILEIARVMSSGLNPLAVTIAGVFVSSYLEEGDDEARLALRFAAATKDLIPLIGPALEYSLMVQQRALVRQASAIGSSLQEGKLPDAEEVAIGFADLVDFTKLGEGVDASRLGAVAAQLEEITRDVVHAPVRLVKTIGDAVMLASSDTEALLDAALSLLDAAEAQEDGFPQLTVGLACGQAIQRGGDFFGHPVNLASRITSTARPGSVLVTDAVKDAVGGENGYAFSFAGERKLKGVKGAQKLFRARRCSTEGSDIVSDP